MATINIKSFLFSKTVWLAGIQGIVGAYLLGFTEYKEVGYALILKSFADIGLRFKTDSPIRLI